MTRPTSSPVRCPCGSRERYADCCGQLHAGRASGLPTAPTAERLMRSRFSAFAVGDSGYLLATWHPSTRPSTLELDDAVDWVRLEVLGVTSGGAGDAEGTVEFIAHYWVTSTRERGQLRELSRFVQERGEWFYVGPVTA